MVLAQIAGCILLMISLPGIAINCYVFYKLLKRPGQFDGFQKLCIAKTIPNIIVCSTFLLWSTPLCIIDPKYTSIPRNLNAVIGQIAGWGAYIFGPLVQVGLAVNRFYVLYFPVESMRNSRFPITNLSISIAVLIAIFYTIIGLPATCGFVFNPEILAWEPEKYACAQQLANLILLSVLVLSCLSNSFNFATFLKLVFLQVRGVSSAEGQVRRRKRIKMYIQSVVQDSLHVFDMINANFTFTLYDAVWFQFLTLSVSFLLIHAMDGFVMFIFHAEIHPVWFLRKWKGNTTTVATRPIKPSTVRTSSHVLNAM